MVKSYQSNFPPHHKSLLAENRSQQLLSDIYFPTHLALEGLPVFMGLQPVQQQGKSRAATFSLNFVEFSFLLMEQTCSKHN